MSGRARVAAHSVRVGPAIRDAASLRAALIGPGSPAGNIEIGPRPERIGASAWRRMSRLSRLVMEVATEALDRAGEAALPLDELFTVWATALGETATTDGLLQRMFREGPDKVSPLAFQTSLFGTPLAHLSLSLGLRGASETISAGGASGAAALARGIDVLDSGRAPAALILGGDEVADMVRTAWSLQPGAREPGEVVAALVLIPDRPGASSLPALTVRCGEPEPPRDGPVWARTAALPGEGPIRSIEGATAAERALGVCPCGGIALAAAACCGGGTVIELDGPTTWTVRVEP